MSGKENSRDPDSMPNFAEFIEGADAKSRDEVVRSSPIDQATRYVAKAVRLEKHWETIVRSARAKLLECDAVDLYREFFDDLSGKIASGQTKKASLLARVLAHVAYRGFGMTTRDFKITSPSKGGTKYRVEKDDAKIKARLQECISGGTFLRGYKAKNAPSWGGAPNVAGSDVSQHRSVLPVPGRFFKWSAPFVLNNAAGFSRAADGRDENLFNPKPDEELLRWMLIDPSYWEEMEPSDYQQCLASAMDVGQYTFDLNYLLKAGRTMPHVIFRDGSLFPQDAYPENYILDNQRGEFVRKAIGEFFSCLSYARDLTPAPLYCGVAKSVQLKLFSAVVDWFIANHIDRDWDFSGYTLNDGTAMNILLSHPDYQTGSDAVIGTCLIRRDFYTRANLNRKIPAGKSLDEHMQQFEGQFNLAPFKSLCESARLQMFFLGHSASPQQIIPRYEFFHHDGMGSATDCASAVFAALRHCGLNVDTDHAHMSNDPIEYLIPMVTFYSHQISKNVGEYIERETGAKIMSRIKRAIS